MSPQRTATGIMLGVLAIAFIAGSIVMVKDMLAETHVLWATFVRMLAGTLGLYLIVPFRPDRKRILKALYPSRAWRSALPGSIAGNYLAIMAWLAGMKYTLVSVAAVFNQLSTVFIFILAAVFLKEPVTPPRLAAAVLAVSGAVLVALSV